MRIRPDGVELLQAARIVIDAAIAPHLTQDCRDTLRAVEQAMALATDRLTRDEEASKGDLLALEHARAAMRGTVSDALPQERRHDARLVSKAISVATLQLANAPSAERREFERLAALLGIQTEPHPSIHAIRSALPALNERLVARIRAGEADSGAMSHAATFAYLEATTHEALLESNPTYRRRTMIPSRQIRAPRHCGAATSARVDDAQTAAANTASAQFNSERKFFPL